jgi:hypothetical protein
MNKRQIFKLAQNGSLAPGYGPQFFKWAGEKRPAKQGEYFISGAIPEVYYAQMNQENDNYIALPTEEPPKQIFIHGVPYNRAC